MRVSRFILPGIAFLVAALLFWFSIHLSKSIDNPAKIVVLKYNSPSNIRYEFIPSQSGNYQILLIGKFKQNDIEVDKNSGKNNLLTIVNSFVYNNDKSVVTNTQSLSLAPDAVLRRNRILGFAALSGIKYSIAMQFRNLSMIKLHDQVEVIISIDPREYKDNLVTSMILKIFSFLVLLFGGIGLVWKLRQ